MGGRKMNRTCRVDYHRSAGIAIVSVMAVVVLLLILGAAMLSTGLQGQLFALRTGSQIKARCAADAGLAEALWQMNQRLGRFSFDDSVLPEASDSVLPNCNARFSYAVRGDEEAGYSIECVGVCGPTSRKVGAKLRLRGLFDYGILVVDSATLYSGTVVDRYNSADPGETDVAVQVASINTDPSSITLMPGAVIKGETLFGVDFDFPELVAPALPDKGTEIRLQGRTVGLTPADSGCYRGITLMNGGGLQTILEISGGHVELHVTGDVWMGQGSQLVIKPDASLSLFLDGNWTSNNSTGINNETNIPACFKLYGMGTDQVLDLKAKEDWYGCIYAPAAEVSVKANSDLYGSIVARTFENKAKGTIRYDGALSKVPADEIGARFVVDRWYEN